MSTSLWVAAIERQKNTVSKNALCRKLKLAEPRELLAR
jgi:hypothetical protein